MLIKALDERTGASKLFIEQLVVSACKDQNNY